MSKKPKRDGRFKSPPRATKAGRLIELFGGVNPMSRVTGIAPATISRMDSTGPRGKRGVVPPQYNVQIVEGARTAGLDLAAVAACLDEHVCPCCGSQLEPGQVVHIPR